MTTDTDDDPAAYRRIWQATLMHALRSDPPREVMRWIASRHFADVAWLAGFDPTILRERLTPETLQRLRRLKAVGTPGRRLQQ